MADSWVVQDGIIEWFKGPEWDSVALEIMEKNAERVVSSAQRNAPWTDRTGNAREGLEARVWNDGGIITLSLFHTVEYGRWLELIQSGRFSTIMKTLEQEAPSLLREVTAEVMAARQGVNYS